MALIKELFHLGALPEAIEVCKRALEVHNGDTDFSQRRNELEELYDKSKKDHARTNDVPCDEMPWGHIWSREYPWAPAEIYHRGEKTINWVNGFLGETSPIRVQASSLSPGSLGVFAFRNIRLWETFVSTLSATEISNSQTTGMYCYNCSKSLVSSTRTSFECCSDMKVCGRDCRRLADLKYHKALCGRGRELTWVYENGRSGNRFDVIDARIQLMFLRVLAICVQADESPLAHDYFSSIVANYNSPNPLHWPYQGHVVGPQRILQALGVDIFKDERYDQWVLQTVW